MRPQNPQRNARPPAGIRPAVEEEEGRDVSDATALPIVQIAQHALQGLAARQAGRELPLVQPDIRRESPQRRVRIVARRSLLHPLEQQVVHGPELALIPGAFGPRKSTVVMLRRKNGEYAMSM
jgi:hypothetical protein